MAQLYFEYGTMKSGKSADLLMTHYNYESQNKTCLLYTSSLDDRYGKGFIKSRMSGSKLTANLLDNDSFEQIKKDILSYNKVYCILVDESQFLSKEQVVGLSKVVDELNISVICYGLRADFKGELFTGSKALLELADKILEKKTVCEVCNRKATMNLRTVNNVAVYEGEQIVVGDEEYHPTCRKCWLNWNYKVKNIEEEEN